jgi:hypothetical protein
VGLGLEALATRCRRCDGAIWSDRAVSDWLADVDRAFHGDSPGRYTLHPRLSSRPPRDGLCVECYDDDVRAEHAGRRWAPGPTYRGRSLASEAEQVTDSHWRAWISLELGDRSNVSLNVSASAPSEQEARVRVTVMAMQKIDTLG